MFEIFWFLEYFFKVIDYEIFSFFANLDTITYILANYLIVKNFNLLLSNFMITGDIRFNEFHKFGVILTAFLLDHILKYQVPKLSLYKLLKTLSICVSSINTLAHLNSTLFSIMRQSALKK